MMVKLQKLSYLVLKKLVLKKRIAQIISRDTKFDKISTLLLFSKDS